LWVHSGENHDDFPRRVEDLTAGMEGNSTQEKTVEGKSGSHTPQEQICSTPVL